jgi:hypothetical protein
VDDKGAWHEEQEQHGRDESLDLGHDGVPLRKGRDTPDGLGRPVERDKGKEKGGPAWPSYPTGWCPLRPADVSVPRDQPLFSCGRAHRTNTKIRAPNAPALCLLFQALPRPSAGGNAAEQTDGGGGQSYQRRERIAGGVTC